MSLDPRNVMFNLQVARVVRCAGHDARRLFTDPLEMGDWLGDLLTDAERAALRGLLATQAEAHSDFLPSRRGGLYPISGRPPPARLCAHGLQKVRHLGRLSSTLLLVRQVLREALRVGVGYASLLPRWPVEDPLERDTELALGDCLVARAAPGATRARALGVGHGRAQVLRDERVEAGAVLDRRSRRPRAPRPARWRAWARRTPGASTERPFRPPERTDWRTPRRSAPYPWRSTACSRGSSRARSVTARPCAPWSASVAPPRRVTRAASWLDRPQKNALSSRFST